MKCLAADQDTQNCTEYSPAQLQRRYVVCVDLQWAEVAALEDVKSASKPAMWQEPEAPSSWSKAIAANRPIRALLCCTEYLSICIIQYAHSQSACHGFQAVSRCNSPSKWCPLHHSIVRKPNRRSHAARIPVHVHRSSCHQISPQPMELCCETSRIALETCLLSRI